jgi:hypothetical protein
MAQKILLDEDFIPFELLVAMERDRIGEHKVRLQRYD